MERIAPSLVSAVGLIAAVGLLAGCEPPHTAFLPKESQPHEVTVEAGQPTFLRDAETGSLWLGATRTEFQGDVSLSAGAALGAVTQNGMKFELTVEPGAAHYYKKHEDGMWEEAHGSATHHLRLEVTETVSGHAPHGEEAVPTHVHDGAIYPTGTTTGALAEEIEFEPVMSKHGYRYVANLALGAVLTDATTYDIVAKIKEPDFHRDHEINEIWKGDTTVTFTGTWATAGGFTLTTKSVTVGDFVASLSASTTPKTLYGAANNGIPTGADTALTVKLIVDEATTHMEEHAREAKGRLFGMPLTVTLKNTETGGRHQLTLEPFWSEHHGFYYGANFTLPLSGSGAATATDDHGGGGHMH